MPSSFQRLFEYFEVGCNDLLFAEIIPFKIPVLYKGKSLSTTKWMNFETWLEVYVHLDDVVKKYSQKSISKGFQYVKGLTVIIGYQFESADPPDQNFPTPYIRKDKLLKEKGKVPENIEFHICPVKLIVCVYPLLLNSLEMKLPSYYIREGKILERILKNEVGERIFLSQLNKERRKRLSLDKPEKFSSSQSDIFSSYNKNKDDSDCCKLNFTNSSLESPLISNIISSTPDSGSSLCSSILNCKVKKREMSTNSSFKNVMESRATRSKCKENINELSDFKIRSDKERKNGCQSKGRAIKSGRERKKLETTKLPKNKNISIKKEKILEEITGKEKQLKMRNILKRSCSKIFDRPTDFVTSFDISSNSVNDFTTEKEGDTLISNSIVEDKNKLNCDSQFSKAILEEKIGSIKKGVNTGSDFSDSLPDLLNGFDKISDADSLKQLISESKEIILNETAAASKSYSSESFSSAGSKSSEVKGLSLTNKKVVEKFKVLNNALNISSKTSLNFTIDSWSDTLPDLTQGFNTEAAPHCLKQDSSDCFSRYFTKNVEKCLHTTNKFEKGRNKKVIEKCESKSKFSATAKDKSENNKVRTCNKRKKINYSDLPLLIKPTVSLSEKRKRDDWDAEYSLQHTGKKEKRDVTQNKINTNSEAIENSEDNNCSTKDISKDNFIERVYNCLRNLTINDFKFHLKKNSSYFENLILGKIPNERDKKMFLGPHVPRDISSECFVSILDEKVIDQLVEMCQENFSNLMKSSGRNITEVLYCILVIIPELIKKVFMTLPCAKENGDITDSDCEDVFYQLSIYGAEKDPL